MTTRAARAPLRPADSEDLPDGWSLVCIRDHFDIWGGGTPSKANPAYWGGEIPWISSKDVKRPRVQQGTEFITESALTETRLRTCPPLTVLVVVRSGILAHTLPVAVTDAKVVINQDIKAFWSPEPQFNEWLALALRAMATQILHNSRKDGTTVHSVQFDQLRALEIPVPPLAEQRRIVAQIEALLAQVHAARARLARVPALLKRFRQSVLAAACDGRLTEDWREVQDGVESAELLLRRISSEHRSWDRSADDWRLDGLPERWWWARMDQLARVGTGATPLRTRADYYAGGTIPWITSAAVNHSPIISASQFITEAALAETNAKVFQPGTLLLAMYGEGATRGKVAELGIAAATNQALAAIQLRGSALMVKDYLNLFLRTNYEEVRGLSIGGVQPNLNLGIIRSMAIPLPPLVEQQEIVRRVEALFALADAIERRVAAATARAEKLSQAILARAFRGELVPTEAELARREGREYERASVLLERIQRERR